jgi:hypothetical protein
VLRSRCLEFRTLLGKETAQWAGDIVLKAGQVLCDNDPRYPGRKVEVVRVEGSFAPRQIQIRLAYIFSDGEPRRSGCSAFAPNDSARSSTNDTQ